ncbi:acyltransferase family protein [Enterococcus devriesei]|uniref:acyltransferase n=1 Tax=Enterococcus devriesei TaxID=319970 RepID=UPI002890059F|nr:acyltransferase family protein [Enterococcus devriesei]MDT2820815.1 acyltransferase family protein [Enterococcus devriesei]
MKKRNYSLDLLKIICMFLIVVHHFSLYTGFTYNSDVFSARDIFLNIIALGGKIGVNIFMLISGYFLYSSKFSLKKLIHLELVTVFFSLGFFMIFVFFSSESFSFSQLIINAMPTTFGRYWFIKAYMFVYLLSPFINLVLKKIDKKKFLILIAILLVWGSIMPTFSNLIARNAYFDNTSWLIIVYVLGCYFRRFDVDFQNRLLYWKLLMATFFFLILGCIGTYQFDLSTANKFSMNFYGEAYHVPIFIISIYLFLVFKNITINRCGTFIYGVSSLMFGVYLIHENFYMRELLWKRLAFFLSEKRGFAFAIDCILFSITVFWGCTLIEFIRNQLLRRLFSTMETFIYNRIKASSRNK